MSLLKANSVQIGQSSTATNNFTLSVPTSPDGTIKLARGNSGATTADVLTVNASGAITGATISGATINSSTLNGGSITLGTAQNSTSGTAIDFTGIPSWVKRVTVMFNGVSLSGSAGILVQIGSGSIATSAYASYSVYAGASNQAGNIASTAGFIVFANSTSNIIYGSLILSNISSNNWVSNHTFGLFQTPNTFAVFGGGTVSLSGSLDRLRVTSTSTDTFDAGSINIMYEG